MPSGPPALHGLQVDISVVPKVLRPEAVSWDGAVEHLANLALFHGALS
jgi:hypothetical protein